MSEASAVPARGPNPPRENALVSLAFNILIPVLALKKLTEPLGPATALIIALAFPLAYGGWDLLRTKKPNAMSILGLLNTLITGGLALIGVTGHWFAVKEAAFPLLIGLFVFFSATRKRSAIELLFLNPQLFRLERLQESVAAKNLEARFRGLMTSSTRWLAVSFFLSAALNLGLALMIFEPLPLELAEADRQSKLNEQIASMTQWSLLVILLPSMVFLMTIFFVLVKKLKGLTGLTDDELLNLK